MKITANILTMAIIVLLFIPVTNYALQSTLSGEMWGRWTHESIKALNTDNSYVDKVSNA
jgi:hypothetical protein